MQREPKLAPIHSPPVGLYGLQLSSETGQATGNAAPWPDTELVFGLDDEYQADVTACLKKVDDTMDAVSDFTTVRNG